MADAQDRGRGCTRFKRPAQGEVQPSTKRRKCKRLTQRQTDSSRVRARVDIGLAFERWRALKAANGLKSDAEVAVCLLDV